MRFLLILIFGFGPFSLLAQSDAPKKLTKKAKFTYTNVHECKVEFICYDSTVDDKAINGLVSFMYRIGAKDRGVENEFKEYRVFDFSKTNVDFPEEYLVKYAKNSIKQFEKSNKKLKKAIIDKKFESIKQELVRIHDNKLKFEKIIKDWYVSGDEKKLRNDMNNYYTDIYVVSTLDHLLGLEKKHDKWMYTYVQLYDIVRPKMFPDDKLIEIQNRIMYDYLINVYVDPTCK